MTRGPWFVGKLDQDEWDIDLVTVGPFEADDHYEDTIAEVSGANHDAMKNAILIAAAPDLLAACQAAISYVAVVTGTGATCADPAIRAATTELERLLEAAIARATTPPPADNQAKGE